MLFQKLVSDAKSVRVTDVSKKEDRKTRPHGLNTVDMLKVSFSALPSCICVPDEDHAYCMDCSVVVLTFTYDLVQMLMEALGNEERFHDALALNSLKDMSIEVLRDTCLQIDVNQMRHLWCVIYAAICLSLVILLCIHCSLS
jgi:hypothetical protein